MEGDNNGSEKAQLAQADEWPQGQSQKPAPHSEVTDVDISAYEVQIAERDERIKALEAQVADAAKAAEATEQLKSQIEELREQGKSDRLDFELKLVGCRNVKAARAVLDERARVGASRLSRGRYGSTTSPFTVTVVVPLAIFFFDCEQLIPLAEPPFDEETFTFREPFATLTALSQYMPRASAVDFPAAFTFTLPPFWMYLSEFVP